MSDMKKRMTSIAKTQTAQKKLDSYNKADNFLSVVIVVFAVLFIVSYVRSLTGAGDLSFESFLNSLSTVPQVSFSMHLVDLTIYGSWGVFEFLRNFLNLFTGMFSVLIFLFGGLIQLLLYVIWCVRWLFVF